MALQPLVATLLDPANREDPSVQSILDGWRTVVARNLLAADIQARLADALRIAIDIDTASPPGLALLYTLTPSAFAHPGLPLEQRWAALRHLATLHRPSPPRPQPGLLADVHAPPPHDLLANAGLVRIAGSGALQALVVRADQGALCEALVRRPHQGAALLAVPMVHRRDRSTRRHLLLQCLKRHGAQAAPLVAHVAAHVPANELGLLHTRPAEWPESDERPFLEAWCLTLAELDGAGEISERRSRQLTKAWAESKGPILRVLLTTPGLDSPAIRDIITGVVRATEPGQIATLPASALLRLLELEADLPYAVAQGLGHVLSQHEDPIVARWAAKTLRTVTPAPTPSPAVRPSGTHPLTDDEVRAVASASDTDLPDVIASLVDGPVSGLLEVLAARTAYRSPGVCLGILQSTESLLDIAAALSEWGAPDEDFTRELELMAVRRFSQHASVAPAMGMWLWRWQRPFSSAQGLFRTHGLDVVLVSSVDLPSPLLRARLWQACRCQIRRWRWRDPEIALRRLTAGVLGTCATVLAPRRTGAATRLPGTYTAHEADHRAVSLEAARILMEGFRLGISLHAFRDAVEQVLADLPSRVAAEFAPWLGEAPLAHDDRDAAPESPPPPPDLDLQSLDDPETLAPWLRDAAPATVELTAVRLLELGDPGAHVLLHELASADCPHPDLVSQAVAAFSEGPALASARQVARDPSRAPQARFYVGLALAEGNAEGPDAAIQALLDGAADDRWLRASAFERLLDQVPAAARRTTARALATSPHYPAYRWAVRVLAEEPGEIDLERLEAFLVSGTSRHPSMRVTAAESLRDAGRALGAPILAAHQAEQIRAGGSDFALAVSPSSLLEILHAAVLAGPTASLPLRRLGDTLSAPGVPSDVREQGALALLHEADDIKVQSIALHHLGDTRSTRNHQARRLAHVFLWGRDQAKRLLRRSYEIRLVGGPALGWTRLEQRAIHVNPVPMLRGERHGAALLKGLIIHELGHHVYNADRVGRAIWAQAQDAGLARLHNLVCDEHLERNLRSRDPHYDESPQASRGLGVSSQPG